MRTFRTFGLTVFVCFIVNDRLALCEVGLHLGNCFGLFLEPGRGKHLRDGPSLLGVKSEHTFEERLEFGRIDVFTLSFSVSVPEKICSLANQKTVVRVIRAGLAKWRPLRDHHE